ncbi:FHA domain-containing protein [Lyngbya confervoides]|uniref:FHA domain-containing protein n=1 Tax=Lyngbya confervoides BDU141951 TaxID=1574623 RepID=A0ABD4T1V8_9CYAN|nr:FHA domain-containing protein [Lyngbya confervoides]MCM1982746.1 FHA domain-containing protein [Lyngbya confervoides BDU141951]
MENPNSQERHVIIVNAGEQKAYALEAAAYSIGRDQTNAIVLEFETISRQHALLLRVPKPNTHSYQYRLIDGNAEGKASANGVFVNGEQVKSQELKNGDSISFGQHVKAAYLTLSMGDAEFVNYLESISYQSLKSELVDTKATMVGMGFDEMFADSPTSVTTVAKAPPPSIGKLPQWQATLSDTPSPAIADLHANLSSPQPDPSPSTSTPTSSRLWMGLMAGLVLLGFIGAGIFYHQASLPKRPAPEATR